MANVGLIILIVLTICISASIIILLIFATISFSSSSSHTSTSPVVVVPATCADSINVSTLLQIPSSTPACVQNNVTTNLYYIGELANGKYDFVVAPWTTSPLDVCVAFCTQYTAPNTTTGNTGTTNTTGNTGTTSATVNTTQGTCTGASYNGLSAQENFNNCMQLLNPVNTTCTPPAPIAAIGTTLYYPYSPTNNVCSN